MLIRSVRVPAPLLLDRHLSKSAKLLWLLLQANRSTGQTPYSPAQLEAQSRLARNTILQGLARLNAVGWLPMEPKNTDGPKPHGWAVMPVDLIEDVRVRVHAKLLYGILQLTPGFKASSGQFTYAELSNLADVCLNSLKMALHNLQQTGWIQLSQRNIHAPIYFALKDPAAERREWEVTEARARLERVSYYGEALMREYLSLIVESNEYEENAAPGFLINPFSGEKLQYDRYYPPRVAFEFNGAQHYGPTARYPDEGEARRLQGRDYIKLGISTLRGIHLVRIHAEDLTLNILRSKVEGLLPMRCLKGHEPLINYLESAGRSYRRKLRQKGYC